jgi:hypothetical protein
MQLDPRTLWLRHAARKLSQLWYECEGDGSMG